MDAFEITIIVLLALIVVLLIVLLRIAIEGFRGVWQNQNAGVEQLCNIEVNTHHASNSIKDHIAPDVKLIIHNILHLLDESEGLPALVDIVDKMHRNLCVEIADKMVDRAFPIKEGEPLDKPFDNPFVPSGATTWPPCYVGGPCTNPHRDCINCPRPNVSGGTWSTSTNTIKED